MIRFRLAELIADKAFRERRVVPLTEVAEATGIHRATLSKMANQPGANIGTEIIDKLCRFFACQPSDLLTYIDDEVMKVDADLG
ncbi:helix-turn-helix domain-containing protein [Pseudoxanthomonas mexicana]